VTPAVSVLVPSYNLGRFLPDTLQSIREQTFEDFECLIGDDGSSEPIRHCVADFLKDRRFSFVAWKPNLGADTAIRFLYSRAGGELWCPFSSDDVYEKDFLQERVNAMRCHPMASLLFGHSRLIDEQGRELPDPGPCFDLPARLPSARALALLVQHNIVTGPGVMLRAAVARCVLPFYTAGWRYTQDWLMWMLMAAAGFDFGWDPRPLVKYRMRSESLGRPDKEGARVMGAENRLLPLWGLRVASAYSVEASVLLGKWGKALYQLFLRRAVQLKCHGALRVEWLDLAARCYYGTVSKRRSLWREVLRQQPGALRTWRMERVVRARQKICVCGNALLDDALFRK